MSGIEILVAILIPLNIAELTAIGWLYKRDSDFRVKVAETYSTKAETSDSTDKIVRAIEGLRDDLKENNKTTQDIMLKVVKLEQNNKS